MDETTGDAGSLALARARATHSEERSRHLYAPTVYWWHNLSWTTSSARSSARHTDASRARRLARNARGSWERRRRGGGRRQRGRGGALSNQRPLLLPGSSLSDRGRVRCFVQRGATLNSVTPDASDGIWAAMNAVHLLTGTTTVSPAS